METVKIPANQLTRVTFIVGQAGGQITAISDQGEQLWNWGLQGGKYYAKEIAEYLDKTDEIELVGDVTAMLPAGNRTRRMTMGRVAYESAANPDFKPSTDSTQAIERMVNTLLRKNDDLERQQKAFAKYKNEHRAEMRAERKRSKESEVIEDAEQETDVQETDETDEAAQAAE